MKITVSKNELYNKLKSIGRIIQAKNATPVYDYFLFEVDSESNVYVTAGEDGARMKVRIDCSADFYIDSFLVPSKTLIDGLKDIPEQPIVIEITKNKDKYKICCIYSGGAGRFELQGASADIFPLFNIQSTDNPIVISGKDFINGISFVQDCVADDELRPVMNGVFIDKSDDKITFVGTNSSMLGMVETMIKDNSGHHSFIVPAKYVRILSVCISPEIDIVEIKINNTNVIFSFGDFLLVCRMIEGRYPNYRAVIPSSNNKTMVLVKNDLLSALKRVSVFSDKSSNLVVFDIKADKMLLSGHDINYSTSAEENVGIVSYRGDGIRIGFNAGFLKDLLSNIPTDKVVFSFKESSTAALIHCENDADINLTYLIMPMSINN